MSEFILAHIGDVSKAIAATLSVAICTALMSVGIVLEPNALGAILTTVITGFLTWLVPTTLNKMGVNDG